MSDKLPKEINLTEVSKTFSEMRDKYDKLGLNLVQALEMFLMEKKIPFLSINYRVKDKVSFIEKIERKKYEKPFEQIEDICGIRIICYYQSDINEIDKIILNELDILENQDKEDLLEADQFGYRSTHFIVKVKNKWLQAPNYRGLENLKAEIQVRTVLMHAWAEIEHKLSYKKDTDVPKQFKRKLYIVSAKLEEADGQFEELKNEITEYRKNIVVSYSKDNKDIELNLDSLQTYLDITFPNRRKDIKDTSELVDQFKKEGITLRDFINYYEKTKKYLPEIESEVFGKLIVVSGWTQGGVVRWIMDISHKDFAKKRGMSDYHLKNIKEWTEKIQEGEKKK